MLLKTNRTLINEIRYRLYKRKLKDQECKFCPIPNDNDIIYKGKYWTILQNKFPWRMCKDQLVVVLNRHIRQHDTDKLTRVEKMEFESIRKAFNYYTLIHNGIKHKSIDHYHYQLVTFK